MMENQIQTEIDRDHVYCIPYKPYPDPWDLKNPVYRPFMTPIRFFLIISHMVLGDLIFRSFLGSG